MLVKDLIKIIEQDFPLNSALSFDNSGANIVDYNVELKNILVCLDITIDAIQYAKDNDVNMIVSHHPIIFNDIKNINDDPVSKRIKLLNKFEINAYSCHTNYDVNLKNGMGINLLNLLFNNSDVKSHTLLETFSIGNEVYGLGDIVVFNKTMAFDNILSIIKSKLSIDDSKLSVYKLKDDINRIIVIPGSGSGDVDLVINEMADLLITSDLKHNQILDLTESGISYINATHYGLEKIFVDSFSNYIANKFNNFKLYKYITNM